MLQDGVLGTAPLATTGLAFPEAITSQSIVGNISVTDDTDIASLVGIVEEPEAPSIVQVNSGSPIIAGSTDVRAAVSQIIRASGTKAVRLGGEILPIQNWGPDPINATYSPPFIPRLLAGGQVTISGTGFGSGPDVQLFDSFSANTHQQVVDLNGAEVGTWLNHTVSAGATGSAWAWQEAGRMWMAGRDPSQLANNVSALSSLRFNLASLQKEFLFAFRWRIANGYNFTSWNQPNVVSNTASNLKQVWWWNRALADLDGDVVTPTFNGTTSAVVSGNAFNPDSTAGGLFYLNRAAMSGTLDNFFLWYQKDSTSEGAYDGTIEMVQGAPGYHSSEIRNDAEPFNRNTGTDPKDGYDSMLFNGWQSTTGGGTYINNLLLYADPYVAIGPNCRARIYTHDQPTLGASNNRYIIPPDSWNSTTIQYTPRAYESLGYHTVIGADGSTLVDGVAV